jgi:hypothetical protein
MSPPSIFGSLGRGSRPAAASSSSTSVPASSQHASGFSSRNLAADNAEAELELKKDLLRVVLGTTLKKNGVPAPWIGGEVNAMVLPDGEPFIEIRFSLQLDEPRFLTYISAFQADFERRLAEVSPDAKHWLSRISWTVTPDPIYESPMPTPEYWEHVMADRELTARQKGAMDWDRESLARHFSDTDPGELVVDYDDTTPPDRQIENLAKPPDNKKR